MFLSKRLLIYFIPVAILILVLVFFLNRTSSDIVEGPEQPPQPTAPGLVRPNEDVKPVENGQSGQSGSLDSKIDNQSDKAQSLKKLQSLLDDEETHDEALKLALELADRGDAEQKLAAIETFNWVGGHEAKMALAKLLATGGAVTENASSALQHLFLEDAQDSSKPFDEEAFTAAVLELRNEDLDALFIVLGGYPVETQAPVLIKLMDTQNESLRELVFETFVSMAEGEEITTKEAAEKWLEKHKAENKAE